MATTKKLSELKPDKKALAWHKKNKWFGKDEKRTKIALILHMMLVKKGMNPRTYAYYEFIDEFMEQLNCLLSSRKTK